MFEKIGLVNLDMVAPVLPSAERRARGPYALFECFQEIPCNPCYTSCKAGAVLPFGDINKIPTIDHDKCSGCAQCVSACPGLACFVIDETYSERDATLKLPYEFYPVPQVDTVVSGLDRQGNVVGPVRVVKVQTAKALDHTNIITIAVPIEQIMMIRNIRLEGPE